jgi:hypothetical protein
MIRQSFCFDDAFRVFMISAECGSRGEGRCPQPEEQNDGLTQRKQQALTIVGLIDWLYIPHGCWLSNISKHTRGAGSGTFELG